MQMNGVNPSERKMSLFGKSGLSIYLALKIITSSVLSWAQAGTLITTFNNPLAGASAEFPNAVAGYSVKSLSIVSAAGDIIIGGIFQSANGPRRNIIGLNQSTGVAGAFNPSNGADPYPNGKVTAIITHSLLGAIVLGGDFSDYYSSG